MKSKLSYYKRIFSDLDRKNVANLYLLTGPEYFIMEEMAGRIVSSIVPEDLRSFNLTVSYGAETDIETFIGAARSYPFMADKRVLLLKELERLKGSWKALIEYCRDPAPSTVLILLFNPFDDSGRRSRQPRDFKALEACVKAQGQRLAFEKLAEEDLNRWIVQKAKKMNLPLDAGTADLLMRSVGENLFDIQNELEKLSIVFEGESVERSDLDAVIGGYRVDALFELVDRIGPAMDASVLKTLHTIITTGAERPSVVVYHTIRHFLALLKIKAGAGGGAGYRFDLLRKKAGRFSTKQILVWLENLRIAELMMKSVTFPEETLLIAAFMHSMRGELLERNSDSLFAA
ncbi:MAG TPA: DNA polymerase III subunit delta [Candidatus Eisenbacteria bacterium]|uniref:DNA polymerase III subunit delta n=1 Tax=Eiseniibacteriota bacterium TaxID=2212470 RepID=A0A7V2F335_UNCEI|nr:DNA polymerase III subunit delta [Candidatus Eisenbacteria bacterium]